MTQEVMEHLLSEHQSRISALEDANKIIDKRLAEMDERYAVINTKLSAILWGIGIIGAALLGALVKSWIPGV